MIKIRFIYGLIITLIFASGCTSSTKYLDMGDYDNALRKSVSKLLKNPKNEKEANVLEKAFVLANQRDEELITQKKEDGSAQCWDQIAGIYSEMKVRQQLIKKVVPLTIGERTIDFESVNYDEVIRDAKKTASLAYYDHAKKLMEGRDKKSNRNAYYEFERARKLNPELTDIEHLMQTTRDLGTTLAGVTVRNETDRKFSPEFISNVIAYGAGNLNKDWIKYTVSTDLPEMEFDFIATVVLKKIEFSPESQKENTSEHKKDIQDGWTYEYDAKGNVKKDTAGNDIKKPKMKTITCKLTEVRQYKKAVLYAVIEYVNNRTGELIKQENVTGENVFENYVLTANGDLNALSTENRKRLGGKLVAFPSEGEMLQKSCEKLKSSSMTALRRNSVID